jgi:hypothetical protein
MRKNGVLNRIIEDKLEGTKWFWHLQEEILDHTIRGMALDERLWTYLKTDYASNSYISPALSRKFFKVNFIAKPVIWRRSESGKFPLKHRSCNGVQNEKCTKIFKVLFYWFRYRQYVNALTRVASCTVIMKVMTKCGLRNTASFIFITSGWSLRSSFWQALVTTERRAIPNTLINSPSCLKVHIQLGGLQYVINRCNDEAYTLYNPKYKQQILNTLFESIVPLMAWWLSHTALILISVFQVLNIL